MNLKNYNPAIPARKTCISHQKSALGMKMLGFFMRLRNKTWRPPTQTTGQAAFLCCFYDSTENSCARPKRNAGSPAIDAEKVEQTMQWENGWASSK